MLADQLLALSVGVGLGVSLLFTEFFGLAAGGMVVPGYIALYLHRPEAVVVTLAAGVATFAIVQAMSSVVVVYGRRRTALMILVGYLVGIAVTWLTSGAVFGGGADFSVIGFIIPGLIGIWIARQGVVETISSIVTVSIVVRLVLVVVVGDSLT